MGGGSSEGENRERDGGKWEAYGRTRERQERGGERERRREGAGEQAGGETDEEVVVRGKSGGEREEGVGRMR